MEFIGLFCVIIIGWINNLNVLINVVINIKIEVGFNNGNVI